MGDDVRRQPERSHAEPPAAGEVDTRRPSGTLGLFGPVDTRPINRAEPKPPEPPPPPPAPALDPGAHVADPDLIARFDVIEELLRDNASLLLRNQARLHELEQAIRPQPIDDIVDAVRRELGTVSVDLTPVLEEIRSGIALAVPAQTDLDVEAIADTIRARFGDLSLDAGPLLDAIDSITPPPPLDAGLIRAAVVDALGSIPSLDAVDVRDAVAAALDARPAEAPPAADTSELERILAAVQESVSRIPPATDPGAIAAGVADQVAATVTRAAVDAFDERQRSDRAGDRSAMQMMVETLVADQNGSLAGLASDLRSIGARLDESANRSNELQDTLASVRSALSEFRVVLANEPLRSAGPSSVDGAEAIPAADIDTVRRTIAASHRALATQLSTLGAELVTAFSRDRELLVESINTVGGRGGGAELVALDQLAREVAALRRDMQSLQERIDPSPAP